MKQTKMRAQRWALNGCLEVIGLLGLVACGSSPPAAALNKIQIERVKVPASLLTVATEPSVPASRMQSAAADYIVHLKINDDECHVDIGAIASTQQ